jgi:hypothetical protein
VHFPDGRLRTTCAQYHAAHTFHSQVNTALELYDAMRCEHRKYGKPFSSICFANHGPSKEQVWTIAKDLQISVVETIPCIAKLAPLVEVMTSMLDSTVCLRFMPYW